MQINKDDNHVYLHRVAIKFSSQSDHSALSWSIVVSWIQLYWALFKILYN